MPSTKIKSKDMFDFLKKKLEIITLAETVMFLLLMCYVPNVVK